LTAGTEATVTLNFNPDVCTYAKFDYPVGTAAITVDVSGPTGTTWLDTTLLINGLPLAYRNYRQDSGYGAETSSGDRYSVCTGVYSPCDYNVPDLHEAAGTLYICTTRYYDETTAATATVKANVVPLVAPSAVTATGYTLTNTMPATPADYEYFGYWITLTQNVTSFDVTTSGSSVRLYFPTLYSYSAWSTGNSRSYPAVGTFPVLVQVASGASNTDIDIEVTDACASTGGLGSSCLTPNVTTVGTTYQTTIDASSYIAYSVAVPSSAAETVAVTLDFGDDLGYELSVYYMTNGQVAGYYSNSAGYTSGSTNVTIHGVPTGADFYFTVHNDMSSALEYNLTASFACDTCTRGTCDLTTYTCTCATGLTGDNCYSAITAASTSSDVTVSVTDAEVVAVIATFVAEANTHYRINVSLADSYNFAGFWVVDEVSGQSVVPVSDTAEGFSIFVPHQSLVAGNTYRVVTPIYSSTRPLTYTINLTTASESNSASAFGFNPIFIALVALFASILALF